MKAERDWRADPREGDVIDGGSGPRRIIGVHSEGVETESTHGGRRGIGGATRNSFIRRDRLGRYRLRHLEPDPPAPTTGAQSEPSQRQGQGR